jgi:tRNA threonylcarbamoyladenosine biosynthesis protein TsaE
MKIDLPDLESMQQFGAAIADKLQIGDIVALSGGLGAGKTTLARAILGALGHKGEVPSPTFTIVEMYESPPLRLPVAHADFYRLETPEEALELGLDDYRDGATLVAEWPENAGGFAHEAACLSITIDIVGEGRRVIVEPGADWLERLP